MAEEITIPKDLLSDFKGGLSSEQAESDSTENAAAVRSLERSLDWLINTLDSTAKEKGYPGIGKMNSGELAQLSVVVIERNMSAEWMQRSPEIMLGGVLSSIVAQNIIHAQKMKDSESEQPEEKGENEQQ